MATVYPRGARWYLNWFEGGKQQRRSLGKISATEAENIRKGKELELATGQRIFFASAAFDAHLERYLSWHRTQYPDSHFRVKQIAEQCFDDFRGRGLSQIVTADIERWKAARMTRVGFNRHGEQAVMSSETAAKELRTLKAVLAKAVEWGEIGKNPSLAVKPPKNLRSQPIHWYTKAELGKLCKDSNYASIWRLVANTGLRRAEAMQLRKEHVNLKDGYINVLSSEAARTKSGRWRQVPLSDRAKVALKALLKRSTSDHVLPRMTGESLSRAFLRDVASRKMDGSLHSLRHTYGAHLVMAGVPLRTVQVLMGHASFSTTERYAHVGKDHLREQAKLVNL